MVVTLFTAFPKGFSIIFTALLVPFVIALIGINFRGAASLSVTSAKRSAKMCPWWRGPLRLPAFSPHLPGMAVTAIASGRIILADDQVQLTLWGWVSPFTLVGGLVGMAVCAYLTPIYMTVRTVGALRDDFRRRGMAAALALGVITTMAVPVAMADAPLFAQRLLRSWPLVFVSLAVLSGLTTQMLLWRRQYLAAQIVAAGTVVLTISGFSAALYPDLIIGQLTIAAAAAPPPTLKAFLTVLPLGALILVPSLVYLYWTFRGEPDPHAPPGKRNR